MSSSTPTGPEGRGRPSAQDTGSSKDDALARALGDLARSLEEQESREATLDAVVAAAVQMVPGAQEGSLSVVTGRRDVRSQSASSDLPRRVDALQAETGQGPCLDSVFVQQTVRVSDMRTEQRWPRFTTRAAEVGVLSMLSCQLFVEGDNLGALNLFARSARAFDDESEHVGLLFATHAAVAFAGVQKQEQLRAGMDTRDLIGMAKGILVERHHLTPDQAFAVLTRYSQRSNRKLRDIADELVHSGSLPGPAA